MILYLCETCGAWRDVSLGKALTDMWNKSFAQMPNAQIKEPVGEACPTGCGLMRQVQAADKLCIVDAIHTAKG
jgi:hypothetical protein